MTRKKIISLLLVFALLCSTLAGTLFTASAEDDTAENGPVLPPNPYAEAAQNLDKEYAYSGDLGCFYTPENTTFKVWAPTSSEVILNLYATGSDLEDGAKKLGTYPMEKLVAETKWTGCWIVTVEGDLKDVYYTYTVTNKMLVSEIERTSEIVDPYAKAVGVNGKRAMVVDLDSTDPEGWDKDPYILADTPTDAVVWELVIRDFSASESSGVSEENRGKFLAFTESGTTLNGEGNIATCVDYLKELGVTHVQLNPMFDFATVMENQDLSVQYNWGYDPENYNVPDGSYSSDPYNGNVRINECKQMIKALHDAGIGVIMDVVYNHTYHNNASNFQRLVPNYYYRFNANGSFSTGTGCGNDTASERAMFRKFMIDSIMYWAQEYHIDGFRFDLMGTHDVETMNLIRESLDTIDTRILMYGEGWERPSVFDATTCTGEKTLPATQVNSEFMSDRIGQFNDEVRDGIKGYVFEPKDKGFVQGDVTTYTTVYDSVRANTTGDECTWYATVPSQTVTYASCHDNHTLYDRLVASVKGTNADYRARYSDLIDMNKLSAGIVMTSQGMPFILAGEEMARSKDGEDNSYRSDLSINAIDWNLLTANADLVSYYKGLIDIRSAFTPFTESTNKYMESYTFYEETQEILDVESTATEDEYITASDYVAFTVKNDVQGEWNTVLVIYNASANAKTVEIDTDITEWTVIANESGAGLDALATVSGNSFEVAPFTCFVAVDTESFDSCGFKSEDGKVIIKHVDKDTGDVLASNVITGALGTGYSTQVTPLSLIEYDYVDFVGETSGIFSEEDQVITCNYQAYKAPSLLAADVDQNGRVAIGDATTIQKYIVGLASFTDELLTLADVDYSGDVNVRDATMLRKDLAGFRVSIGTLVTNFYELDEEGNRVELAPSTTQTLRVGAEYKATPVKATLLDVSEELSSGNAKGILPAGTTTVDFVYVEATTGVRINAIHLDPAAEWTPNLWAWSALGSLYSSWPGAAMELGEDGWYFVDTTLPRNDYSIIISNNGTPQTADYTGLAGGEIWIVIDDYNMVNGGNFLKVYEEMPDVEALRAEALATAPTDAE